MTRKMIKLTLTILVATTVFVTLTRNSLAEEGGVINNLPNDWNILSEVVISCSKSDVNKTLGGHTIAYQNWLLEGSGGFEQAGAISPYGLTTHVYYIYALDQYKTTLIFVTHMHGRNTSKHCSTGLQFDTKGKKLALVSGKVRSFEENLNTSQAAYVDELLQKCASLGRKAPEVFSSGNFALSDDGKGFTAPPGYYDCDAAVKNNTSAVTLALGSRRIRIVTIYDRIYVGEY